MEQSANPPEPPILLFDRRCVLCNGAVQFILRHESAPRMRFASLQSDLGQHLLSQHEVPDQLDSMVLVERDGIYAKSEVVWRVAGLLRIPWRLALVLRWVPVALRDWGYDVVARNRYRWFGTQDACLIPNPQQRERFLDL